MPEDGSRRLAGANLCVCRQIAEDGVKGTLKPVTGNTHHQIPSYQDSIMAASIDELKKRLSELDAEIKETKRRLPAHSVKPPVMMDLLALEDEYDEISKQIQDLKGKSA